MLTEVIHCKFKIFLLFSFVLSLTYTKSQNPVLKQDRREDITGAPGLYKNQVTAACNTWTFQVQLNSSRAEIPSDLIAIPGGNYILAGSDSSTAGINGRLIKIGSRGNLITSKELLLNQQHVVLKKLRYFSDGKVYVLGEIIDAVTLVSTPVLLVVDTSGLNVISSARLSMSAGGSWQAIDLREGPDNNFTVLVSNNSLINISKHTFNGSLVWSRCYKTKNNPRPIGLGNENSAVYVAYNETDSGYRKGVVASFDYTTGNFQYSFKIGGLADSTEYEMQSMTMINLRPRITALQIKNNKVSFVRLNVSPTTMFDSKEVFTINALPGDEELITRQSNWSEVLAANRANSNAVFLTFTFPENYRTPVTEQKISYASPVKLCNLIRTADGGSLLVSRIAGTQGGLILTKVDSIGLLPGCVSTGSSATFSWEPGIVSVADTPHAAASSLNVNPVVFNSLNFPLNSIEECSSLYCPEVAEPDTCLRTFFKEYRGFSNSILATHLLKTNDGKLLVIARERQNPWEAADDPSLLLFDTTGKLLNEQAIAAQKINFFKTIKLADGNFVAAGGIYYESDSIYPYLMKFDEKLNIIWQKRFTFSKGYGFIEDIIESAEGDFYCYIKGFLYTPGEKRHLLKLNSYGDVVWLKEYDAGADIFFGSGESYPGLAELGDFIYLKYNEESDDESPFLIKLRKTDGSIIWVKRYQLSTQGTGSSLRALSLTTDNSNIYITASAYPNSILLKISPDGDVIHALQVPGNTAYITNVKYKGGNMLRASSGVARYPNSIYGVIEMDTAFTILRKQFMEIPNAGGINDIQVFSDSVTYGTGNFGHSNAYWSSLNLQKFNFNSSFASCAVNDLILNLTNIGITVVPKNTTVNTLTAPHQVPFSVVLSPGVAGYNRYYCGSNITCDSVGITGPANICDSVNIYSFNANKNAGCTGIINWDMDTAVNQVSIVSLSESVLQLKIKKAGNFTVKAKLFGSCAWIEDSMQVAATIHPASALNLGPDTVLCPGSVILLNAHSGFTSYLWQDGSADSIFSVTMPGKYYVSTGEGCGGMLSDSITVAPYIASGFDIGNDTAICEGDTIKISGPADFANYRWTPSNSLAGTNTATVKAFPVTDTKYTVTAEKPAGCFAYDSVTVTVKHVPKIHLGNDTSFCEGQSLVLDAGAGFDTYQWNTGASGQQITVSQPGDFYVISSYKGCSSNDTLTVTNVFSLPAFTLGADTTLCGRQELNYGFNLPQATYAWSTGSTSNSITLNQPGTYWLTVTQNRCLRSDTIVLAYGPVPVVNLGSDTALCIGATELLSAYNNNASYVWQDGSMAADYVVRKPGLYYVKTTINNCSASDSINVTYIKAPYFTLGEDAFLCRGQQLKLFPSINTFADYLWQDGSNAPFLMVTAPGTYKLTASNLCGTFTDSVIIATGICSIDMPNAFTPNHDGVNDVFRVKNAPQVSRYNMSIYNRWGQKIFESTNINLGWDGTYQKGDAPAGVYVWRIALTDAEGKKQNSKGTVTLIR